METASRVLGATSVLVAAIIGVEPSTSLSALSVGSAVIGGGIVGSVADSLLGATVQGLFRGEHGVVTESRGDPSRPNALIRGSRWVDNDSVNAFCALVGAMFAILILYS